MEKGVTISYLFFAQTAQMEDIRTVCMGQTLPCNITESHSVDEHGRGGYEDKQHDALLSQRSLETGSTICGPMNVVWQPKRRPKAVVLFQNSL